MARAGKPGYRVTCIVFTLPWTSVRPNLKHWILMWKLPLSMVGTGQMAMINARFHI